MRVPDRRLGALADLVKQARLSKGMTQRELSSALNLSDGYVGHLESGRMRPTVETLKALAAVLGLLCGQPGLGRLYNRRGVRESHRRSSVGPA